MPLIYCCSCPFVVDLAQFIDRAKVPRLLEDKDLAFEIAAEIHKQHREQESS